MKMETQKKQIVRLLLAALLFNYVFLGAFLLIPTFQDFLHPVRYIKSSEVSVDVSISYEEDGEAAEEIVTLTRGTPVRLRKTEENVSQIQYNGQIFTISNDNLADSIEEAIAADYVYPRRLVNLREEKGGKLSDTVVTKGEAVKVISVDAEDLDPATGLVKWYQVEVEGENYWLSGSAAESSEAASMNNYGSNLTYSTYWDAYYGDGYSKNAYISKIDYKPVEKVSYESNPMKTDLNGIHVSLDNLITYKDFFLSLIEDTGINAYVVELKGDGGNLFYASDVPEHYMDHPEKALIVGYYSLDDLKEIFEEFQEAGFYMIARIVTFKDAIYASQNPENSMTYSDSGELVLHNDEYWPSPYSRTVWEYNVDIAKEIAPIVNEIQFDYVRFPDGTLEENLSGEIDFHNTYNESKVEALQGFLAYAREELEPYEVYLAADVFAWPIVAKDDQDIGQYLPALANMVDVICPMPYADHFSAGAMGIESCVDAPFETMYEFSKIAKTQLDSLASPPVFRTWIMGYSPYGPEQMELQIEGINEAGYEGYLVWSGAGNYDLVYSLHTGFTDSSLESYEQRKADKYTTEETAQQSAASEDE